MKYYCFPDIHGRNDLLQKALKAVYEQKSNKGSRIIFLGDYIDRGPDNVGVLETVMNPPEGWEFVTLKGNHETMFLGGYYKEHRYYEYEVVEQIIASDFYFPDVVSWMTNLPLVYKEGKNLFAHAYYDTYRKFDEQVERDVVWERYHKSEAFVSEEGYFLTHGHTPARNGPLFAKNRLNLDTGAVFYDRFVIAEFEEGKTGPVGFQEFCA